MITEEWKPVVGYEGLYEVSNHGRLRSLERLSKDGRKLPTRLLNNTAINGRVKVTLQSKVRGKPVKASLHRLVMRAFVGECPNGKEVCHNDGNPSNNNLTNLRYGTRQENQDDRKLHGTDNIGIRHPMAKLTEEEVLDIRRLWSFDFTHQEIADYFCVSYDCCWRIINGTRWSHI